MTDVGNVELDQLLDRLAARAAERARATPLANVAGDTVTPYATTGRIQVNPGDLIASVWGNTTFDQTVQAFDTSAARDAQWPAPKDGAMCYTVDLATLWIRRLGGWNIVPLVPYTPPRYGARYTMAATTSPATVNQVQQMNLGAKVYDQANAVTGNVYTCPAAGRYLVRASASSGVPAGVTVSAYVRRNGTNDTQNLMVNNGSAATIIIPQAFGVTMCAAGDTLDAAWQIGAASIPLRAIATESYFVVEYLGPT